MTKIPTLAECNAHLFAALMPETHAVAPTKKSKGKEPELTAEQQAALDELNKLTAPGA